MDRSNLIHLVPEESLLVELKTKFQCTVEGCGRSLSNYGALRMHLVKTHKVYQNEDDKALDMKLKKPTGNNCAYHCPVEGCTKSLKKDKTNSFFTSMKLLKQHYGKLHAEKKFKCVKCERGFGLERDKRRHEETCGLLFKCLTCGCPYSTVEAMMSHCRRKEHEPPKECLAKSKTKFKSEKSPQKSSEDNKLTAPPANIFVINVLPCQSQSNDLLTISPGFRHILPKPIIQRTVAIATSSPSANHIGAKQGPLFKPIMNKQKVLYSEEKDLSSSCSSQSLSAVCVSSSIETEPVARSNCHTMVDMSKEVYSSVKEQGDMPFNEIACQTYMPSNNERTNASTQYSPNMLSSMSHKSINKHVIPDLSHMNSHTKGMQTLSSQPLRQGLSLAVAETQTPGDYILKQAMTSAQITLNKESKGSQVSPGSNFKGQKNIVSVISQSSQTSRLTEQKNTRSKKSRKIAKKDFHLTGFNKPSYRTNIRPRWNARGTVVNSCNESACVNRPVTDVRSSCWTQTISHRPGISTIPAGRPSLNTSLQSAMLIDDGPHDRESESEIYGTSDFSDHQTQTTGILEELSSLASNISTQTLQSYPSQSVVVDNGTESLVSQQHSHTQTFVSAFSDVSTQPSTCHGNTLSDETNGLGDMVCDSTYPESYGVPNLYTPSFANACNGPIPIKYSHSNVQTVDTDLLNFLDTGIQADSGPGTTIQTQTDMEEMWQLFCNNMQTQTADDLFLQELGFSDIQIQTNMDLECEKDNSSSAETQTMWHSMSCVEQSDMQTQTVSPSSSVPIDTDLTDSHTQTPWEDISSLILSDF